MNRNGNARWNALDPNDEHSALIVPSEDLRELETTIGRYREALEAIRAEISHGVTANWDYIEMLFAKTLDPQTENREGDPYYVCARCAHYWSSPEAPDRCEHCLAPVSFLEMAATLGRAEEVSEMFLPTETR